MKRVSVESSSIASVGYDPEISTLEVEFRNTGCYQYFAVPHHILENLMEAESKGAYLNAHIKTRFPSRRIS